MYLVENLSGRKLTARLAGETITLPAGKVTGFETSSEALAVVLALKEQRQLRSLHEIAFFSHLPESYVDVRFAFGLKQWPMALGARPGLTGKKLA
jgi:hypothetical protein